MWGVRVLGISILSVRHILSRMVVGDLFVWDQCGIRKIMSAFDGSKLAIVVTNTVPYSYTSSYVLVIAEPHHDDHMILAVY